MAKIVTATPNPMLYFAAVFRVSSYKGAHANRGVTHPAVAAAFRLDAHPMQITGEGGATCKPNDRNPFVSKSDTALASKSVAICWAAPAFLSPRILLLSMQRWMWMRKPKRVRVQVWGVAWCMVYTHLRQTGRQLDSTHRTVAVRVDRSLCSATRNARSGLWPAIISARRTMSGRSGGGWGWGRTCAEDFLEVLGLRKRSGQSHAAGSRTQHTANKQRSAGSDQQAAVAGD